MLDRAPITTDLARRVVDEGVRHLLTILSSKGRFIYSHVVGDITAAGDGYNMLRHCGTMWFLLRAVNEMPVNLGATDRAKLAAGVGYAGGKFAPVPWAGGAKPRYGMVTKGAIKTGGIGLALVMLHQFRDFSQRSATEPVKLPEPVDRTIEGLEEYGVAQIHKGDFFHKRRLADGAIMDFESDYYTGEVLLGLFHSPRPQPEAAEVCRGLMAKDYGIDVQSHWMAYAACEAIERGLVEREFGLAYLTRLMRAIIDDPAYRARRDSTPIACRSEALTRALMLARRIDGALPAPLTDQMRRTAEENMEIQLEWYDAGQFWKGDESNKVQIDYIQHNATAFLNWLAVA